MDGDSYATICGRALLYLVSLLNFYYKKKKFDWISNSNISLSLLVSKLQILDKGLFEKIFDTKMVLPAYLNDTKYDPTLYFVNSACITVSLYKFLYFS